jgi:hypothetical protein
LQKKFLAENIYAKKKKKIWVKYFCEEPDSLQKNFLSENILCQEKKYSEENIFVKSQTHWKRNS